MGSLRLAQVLDISASASLRSALLERRDEDLDLDASQVERLGGLCLQVLLAAREFWSQNGKSLRIIDASGPCVEALRLAHAAAFLGLED